jgi:acetylornithine/N-succinyldiaminopimelate aminotransferase
MDLFKVYSLFDIELVKGEGCYLWDERGRKYLDLYGGHAVISIGHSHPHYVNKLSRQLSQIGFYSNSVKNHLQAELAIKLGQMSGYEDYQLFLCNSGAEANENALKIASFFNQKKKVISFFRAFHGRTSAAVAVTDNPKIQAPLNKNNNIIFLEFNNIENFENILNKEEICAVIIEGIQGIGGIHVPQKKFLTALEKFCQKNKIVLILDEIQSGYGRTGKFFAHQYGVIQPDIITVAKGMGNGFPIAGVLIHPKFKPKVASLGTTFGGNHLACAAALAVLEVIENENLLENAKTVGTYLIDKLISLKGVIREIRGKGLMIGIELPFSCSDLRYELLTKYKILTGGSADKNTLRILPPLTLQKSEADFFLEVFSKILNQY